MNSKPAIGRPPKDKVEDGFKKCIQKHLARNMLECKVMDKVHTMFLDKGKEYNQMTQEQIRQFFLSQNEDPFYEKLQEIRNTPGTTVNSKDIQNYTSKKDILYLLHQCKPLFKVGIDEKNIISTKQLYLLIIFYLHKSGLVSDQVCQWMHTNYASFTATMRNGPTGQNNPEYQLVELLTRWALEMAALQELNISFEGNKSHQKV